MKSRKLKSLSLQKESIASLGENIKFQIVGGNITHAVTTCHTFHSLCPTLCYIR
jgi:hypothetical protein